MASGGIRGCRTDAAAAAAAVAAAVVKFYEPLSCQTIFLLSRMDHLLLLLLLLLQCRRQLINQSCCLFDIPTSMRTFWIFLDGRKILLVCVCVCAQFSCEKRAKFTRFSCKNCVNFTGFSHNAVFPCELSPGWSVCWSVGRLRRLTFLLKIKLLNTPCRKERTLRLKGKMLSAATKKQSN